MHGMIQQVSRNILNKLKKAGMDFDQYETKTTHGLSRCVINVYESFDEVNEVIKSEVNRIAGVAVRLHPVKHRSILYLPTEDRDESVVPRKLLVVGIDAGTTVGIAVANVSGNLIALHSGRGWSRGDVIRKIVEYGKPILIATDVSPVPNFIEKLSNSLKTQLFTPQKVLSVIEKRELAKSFAASSEISPANAHQRDALAAVSKVFQTYENKLQLLDKKLVEKGQTQVRSEAIVFVLKGLSVNDAVEKAIAKIETKTEPAESTQTPVRSKRPSVPKELKQLVQRLNRQIISLQRQLEHEQTRHSQTIEEKNTLKDELQSTKRQLNRILSLEHREQRKDEKIRQKDEEIVRLQRMIDRLQIDKGKIKRTLTNLKLMRRLEIRGEVQPVLLLPIFSQEEIRRLSERYTKKRRKVVYILNPSGGGKSTADQLIQLGVKAIITKGAMSHLALRQFTTAQIPVIDAENLQMTIVDEFAVTDAQQLEQHIAEWHKHHAITERVEAANALERLVEEYRQERRKENSGR